MCFCLTATYLKDKNQQSKYPTIGTYLGVQWLRLQAPNEGGPGSTPGQGIHIPQLRVWMLQLKTPHATIKTQHSQTKLINIIIFYNTTDMKLDHFCYTHSIHLLSIWCMPDPSTYWTFSTVQQNIRTEQGRISSLPACLRQDMGLLSLD